MDSAQKDAKDERDASTDERGHGLPDHAAGARDAAAEVRNLATAQLDTALVRPARRRPAGRAAQT